MSVQMSDRKKEPRPKSPPDRAQATQEESRAGRRPHPQRSSRRHKARNADDRPAQEAVWHHRARAVDDFLYKKPHGGQHLSHAAT